MLTYIIPCGGAKLDTAAAARDLYTGSLFRHQLATVTAEAAQDGAQVLIMSAEHGLLSLDETVAPYDTRITDADSIDAESLAESAQLHGIDYGAEVYAFVPAAYFDRLRDALDALNVYPQFVYEAAKGVGYQRGVCSNVNRTRAS